MPLRQNKKRRSSAVAQVFGNGSRLNGPVGRSGESTLFLLECIPRGEKTHFEVVLFCKQININRMYKLLTIQRLIHA